MVGVAVSRCILPSWPRWRPRVRVGATRASEGGSRRFEERGRGGADRVAEGRFIVGGERGEGARERSGEVDEDVELDFVEQGVAIVAADLRGSTGEPREVG